MSASILESIQTLQRQAEHLEREAVELRQALARIVDELANSSAIVARYEIDGEVIEVTQSDVTTLAEGLTTSYSDVALYEVAASKKLALRLRERSPEEQKEYFFRTIETIRETAIADGTAIDTEADTLISE